MANYSVKLALFFHIFKKMSTVAICCPKSSNEWGTIAPASNNAWFLATAVSDFAFAKAPAWPNWIWNFWTLQKRYINYKRWAYSPVNCKRTTASLYESVTIRRQTSDVIWSAQVPMHHATNGFVIFFFLSASTTLYSSSPPNSPSITIIFTLQKHFRSENTCECNNMCAVLSRQATFEITYKITARGKWKL